jgi:alanine racemase
LKLNYEYGKIASLFSQPSTSDAIIHSVGYDTRKISEGSSLLFFALEGSFRDGHTFLKDAYDKGVRHFVVMEKGSVTAFPDAHEIVVPDSFKALQELAKFHRNQFNYPVVAVTGSYGKTTVKEWLSELLSARFNVVRSPKSYNSRLGVALSLLEMNHRATIAIIEAGISEPGDMTFLAEMIQPTHGIFTSLGSAHLENFSSIEELKNEKLKLFTTANVVFHPDALTLDNANARGVSTRQFNELFDFFPFKDETQWANCKLAIALALELGISEENIGEQLRQLEALSMRLETFDGTHDNLIINDAYNLDEDSLRHALEYQLVVSGEKKRVLVIGLSEKNEKTETWIKSLISNFALDEFVLHYAGEPFEHTFKNSSILIKGNRSAGMEIIAGKFKMLQHQTYLQIDFGAIRKNIHKFKAGLNPTTKLLCMVKASSYGSDARKMGRYLEQLGVNYLGVAYPDEGVELREHGVTLPILVMNCEEEAFSTCISNRLEPAIFSIRQLESFVKELILHAESNYPIHLKLETGMNRLGFEKNHLNSLLQKLQSQPEVKVKSMYSHLAEADVLDSIHVDAQLRRFEEMSTQIQNAISYPIDRHILNSDGIINYPKAQYEMVRLGIGMYGITSNLRLRKSLTPAIAWYSAISQIKEINAGDAVGYSRTFIADKPMRIAVIPVGYADGFSRLLSTGNGGVFINNQYCPTVGNVCMDMIMVDLGSLDVREKNQVEILGPNQTIYSIAQKMGTIPYEVMTHFSTRIHRIFVEG